MKLSKIAPLLLVLFLPAVALAQGSGSTGSRPTYGSSSPAYAVTRSVKGTVTTIEADRGLIVVKDKNGKMYEFKVDNKTKYKAEKKTELRGKKGISLADFQLGQPVKVTYRADDGTITELRLRRSREKRASRS